LFAKPCNVLVMDEPTNDLDMETLDLLEELLGNFDGTLLLVSHDREFLDQVVTSTLVFEENGKICEYVGGYSDWLSQRPKLVKTEAPAPKPTSILPQQTAAGARKRLSFKEQKELEALPERIESLERKQEEFDALINSADFYRQDPVAVKQTLEAVERLRSELETAYLRWDELDAASGSSKG
jgi:ATP-binding cassette subfamily F protein uup